MFLFAKVSKKCLDTALSKMYVVAKVSFFDQNNSLQQLVLFWSIEKFDDALA